MASPPPPAEIVSLQSFISHSHSHSSSTPTTATPIAYDHPSSESVQDSHYEIYNTDPPPSISDTSTLLICSTCGTQFDTPDPSLLRHCRICDDPRQFVPPTGQAFTTLSELRSSSQKYTNKRKPFPQDDRFISIWTEPKFGIGQRAILIKTELGNVLWDCITYLDDKTISWINEQGGLASIVISHPHYYSTHLEWAEAFDCPVYLSWEDKEWLNRLDRRGKARRFIEEKEEEIEIRGEKAGVIALKLGGHFPGSLCLLAFGRLLVADTIVTVPAGLGDWSAGPHGTKDGRPKSSSSYSFMWSIPNIIPLSPPEILGMWDVLKRHEFKSTHGAFVGTEVTDGYGGSEKGVKERVLGSMQIQVRSMGWKDHALLSEEVLL